MTEIEIPSLTEGQTAYFVRFAQLGASGVYEAIVVNTDPTIENEIIFLNEIKFK